MRKLVLLSTAVLLAMSGCQGKKLFGEEEEISGPMPDRDSGHNMYGDKPYQTASASPAASQSAEYLGIPDWVVHGVSDTDIHFQEVAYVSTTGRTSADIRAAVDVAVKKMNDRFISGVGSRYQNILDQEADQQGAFELKIRNAARSQIGNIYIENAKDAEVYVDNYNKRTYVLAQAPKDQIDTQISDRLIELDSQLKDYIHVSDSGRNLEQLMSIIPVLPTIEERKKLKAQLEATWDSKIPLPNDHLVTLVNRQISVIIDNIVFSLEPTTDESEQFEANYRSTLSKEGLNVTSRVPDVVLQYYIEPEETPQRLRNGFKVVLVGDVEMVDSYGNTFSRLSDSFEGLQEVEFKAQEEAVTGLAEKTVEVVVGEVIGYMNDVNRLNFGR